MALLSYAVTAVAQATQVDYKVLLLSMMSIPPCGAALLESEQAPREEDGNG